MRADWWVLKPREYHFSMECKCDVVSGRLSIGHLFQARCYRRKDEKEEHLSMRSEPTGQASAGDRPPSRQRVFSQWGAGQEGGRECQAGAPG